MVVWENNGGAPGTTGGGCFSEPPPPPPHLLQTWGGWDAPGTSISLMVPMS